MRLAWLRLTVRVEVVPATLLLMVVVLALRSRPITDWLKPLRSKVELPEPPRLSTRPAGRPSLAPSTMVLVWVRRTPGALPPPA